MSKRRVLVVDDDVNLSRLSAAILESSDRYEAMIVNDSACALATALQFQPDAMLLDVDMPGLSGGDLARYAAENSRLRNVPILFLTGLLTHEDTGNGPIDSGGQQFLAKPVDPEELLVSMDSLFERTATA
jgi:two-component system OmpR family response regulator